MHNSGHHGGHLAGHWPFMYVNMLVISNPGLITVLDHVGIITFQSLFCFEFSIISCLLTSLMILNFILNVIYDKL
jgi:hypothetical protein